MTLKAEAFVLTDVDMGSHLPSSVQKGQAVTAGGPQAHETQRTRPRLQLKVHEVTGGTGVPWRGEGGAHKASDLLQRAAVPARPPSWESSQPVPACPPWSSSPAFPTAPMTLPTE